MKKGDRDFRSVGQISAALRRRGILPVASDLSSAICAAFHLENGAITALMRNECLYLSSRDKTVRCAVSGMEKHVLSWLEEMGYKKIRRVKWSAE